MNTNAFYTINLVGSNLFRMISKSRFVIGETPEEEAARKAAEQKAIDDKAAAEKKYTQQEVDDRLGLLRKKTESEQRKTVVELEALKKKANLTAEEKKTLQDRIDNMEKTYLTEKELQQRQYEQQLKTEKEAKESLVAERDTYKGKYTTYVIQNSILSEAVKAEAVIPDQVYQILKDQTQLMDDLDGDGKPTGEQVPKVNFSDVDKDGKPVKLVLTIPETMKRMKEVPDRFGNLFKSGAAGGVGSTNKQRGGSSADGPPTDTENYIAQRKAGKL